MPKVKVLEYEGGRYVSDADGLYIRRSDKPLTTQNEESLDCSHIYPSRVGKVTDVEVENAEKHFYNFFDSTIPADLDFTACLIPGETMTVIFQSGMLAGKEFEVKYIHKEKKKDDEGNVVEKFVHRFEIVPQEIDGRTMPDDIFKPGNSDEYAVFGISLPESYVCNNTDMSGASWDMFREAAKYLYENEGNKFTFTGELDGIWAKKDWSNIGGRIRLGGYILFRDDQFEPDGAAIRIVGVKDYINNPHSPVIELSNSVVGSSISSDLRNIENNEIVTDNKYKDSLQFTKRRFRDSIETISMLENALLDKFTNSISPITIRTMSMLVGDESLQFRFVRSMTDLTEVGHHVKWDIEKQILTSPAGVIQHMTIGIDSISSSHKPNEYKVWYLPVFNTPPLTDGSKKYYLYAKVSKEEQVGEFYISETAIALEEEEGFYHLLMGILNSEYDGERSYVTLYGFTEILPGRITTDRVVSSDGLNFLDFVSNAFRVGNNINSLDFNTKGDGKLRLKGTLVQSDSGDEEFIGVFRGLYNSEYTYYRGDEVIYAIEGNMSMYRYIYDEPTKGNLPTDTKYWMVVAQGSSGKDGDTPVDIYCTSISQPVRPTSKNVPPFGWSLTPTAPTETAHVWMSQTRVGSDGSVGEWSTPIRISGLNGEPGADGTDIEFIYKRTRDNTDPSQPDSLQEDDYVPDGWTDNPKGVSATYLYEWLCVRYKNDGVWTSFSTPVVWSKWGETGRDGDGFEYIFKRTTTDTAPSTPGTSQVDDYVPAGWTDDPSGVSEDYPYEWVCIRKRKDGTWGDFSDPALWAKWGRDGDFYEYRYAVNGSRLSPPSLDVTSPEPEGWTTVMPPVGDLQYLWLTIAKKTSKGALLQNWSDPKRITPYDGKDGAAGPSMLFRGIYSNTEEYYGTSKRVDAVKHYNTYYVARSDAGNGFIGQPPTINGEINSDYWNDFGGQFDSVATNLLLAENANIADWIIKSGKITSQEITSDETPRAQMDGTNGSISFASDQTVYTATGGSYNVKQTISLSSYLKSIESNTTEGDRAYLSSQGIYINKAGVNAPGIKDEWKDAKYGDIYAAIVALGNRNLQAGQYYNSRVVCGVYGEAINNYKDTTLGPSYTFGGYFRKLLADGLYLGLIQIDKTTWLKSIDCYISAYNTSDINLYLPDKPQVGQIILVRRMNSASVNVQGNGIDIHVDGGTTTSKNTARGDTAVLIFDGTYWNFNYWPR